MSLLVLGLLAAGGYYLATQKSKATDPNADESIEDTAAKEVAKVVKPEKNATPEANDVKAKVITEAMVDPKVKPIDTNIPIVKLGDPREREEGKITLPARKPFDPVIDKKVLKEKISLKLNKVTEPEEREVMKELMKNTSPRPMPVREVIRRNVSRLQANGTPKERAVLAACEGCDRRILTKAQKMGLVRVQPMVR